MCFWLRWTEPVDKSHSDFAAWVLWLQRSAFFCLRHCWMPLTTNCMQRLNCLLNSMTQIIISLDFPAQILSFRSSFRSMLLTTSTIFEVAHLLLIDYYELSSTFSDVCTAYMLLLTLPVTVATCERSFSKLKLIKNYLRSTMSEERLSDLAMLSIENERARKLDSSKVVDIFAQEKARKRTF